MWRGATSDVSREKKPGNGKTLIPARCRHPARSVACAGLSMRGGGGDHDGGGLDTGAHMMGNTRKTPIPLNPSVNDTFNAY